jgi:DNA polymerase
MDRQEAVLRELNLYPLWKRRGQPAPAEAQAEAAGQPAAGAGDIPPSVEAVATPVHPATVASGSGEQSREQHIATLDWPELKTMVRDCTACKLRAGCTQTVFGVGDEQAGWLFVGEGPGADEDVKGEPFVGQAGKLLDNMLMSIGLRRGDNVYIANVVKCRPPGNRTPEPDEIATCFPYLQRQIQLIQPKVIVALGKTAATALLGRDATLGSLRGTLHDYEGRPLIVTYHPAYLLRSPLEKAKAWEDLCRAVQIIGARP